MAPVADQVGAAVGGFFRGQLVVASFVALASMLVLYIVGLPYWAVVGIIAGVFNLVPMIGPYIGGVVAIFIAFTASESGGGLLPAPAAWPRPCDRVDRRPLRRAAVGQPHRESERRRANREASPRHRDGLVARVRCPLRLLGSVAGRAGHGHHQDLIVHYWDTRVQWPPEERSDEGA